jgi:hypothetical protein
MSLAIFEIDKAITDKRPVELTLLEIPGDFGADTKAEREKQNSKLMVIKEMISEGIHGGGGLSQSVRLLWSTWRRWRVSLLALQRHTLALSSRRPFLRSTPVVV